MSSVPAIRLSPYTGQPFLKWAGGKTQLLTQLERFFPTEWESYFEPFTGSAAVFFYLRRTRGDFPATLMDYNDELVNCFTVVRDDVDRLIPLLELHRDNHGKRAYYALRRKQPRDLPRVARAARLMYLNKVCYNGLYRVNANGEFNVPMGSYKNPRIFNENALHAASLALRDAELVADDFSNVLDLAKPADFIYFDPPYYTDSGGFTGYAVTAAGNATFGAEEHRRLCEVVKDLSARGCQVVLSNSDTDYIRRLYCDFSIYNVFARRAINRNGSGRGPVSELVITNDTHT